MIVDEIVLNNFGLYAGTQTITLTPPSPKKPVVLIGGLNGGGKTTLLDALQLGLFGPHAKISNRGSLGYQEYLSRSIHRGEFASEAAIEISFRFAVEGREEQYRLTRSWSRNDKGCKENLEVQKNGVPVQALADNWASQVEEFFPANIAHLFLFDGEQAEAYATQEESAALIGAAIQNLLGLDLVDQLQKDLLVYERRKRVEDKENPQSEEIVRTQDLVRDLRKSIDGLVQERAALRTHRIDRCQESLREVEEHYRMAGGSLYDRRKEIERKLLDAQEAVRDGERALRELAAGALPLILVRVLLESAGCRDGREEESRLSRKLVDVLRVRDRAALRLMRTNSADQRVVEELKKLFTTDRKERQAMGELHSVLNLASEVRSDLHSLLSGGLEDLGAETHRLLRQQEDARKLVEQAQIEWENVPAADAIEKIYKEREALKSELEDLKSIYTGLEQEISRQRHELERREQRLARLIEEETKAIGANEDRARILQHSARVRATFDKFKRSVVIRNLRRIEALVLESYQQLLRKSALVTRLLIDPETFSLTLHGRDGNVLSAERLSAGERQLLAIALLWGLAKASGRPLPTAIDTPLGRLDSNHRMHLVERYLPFASHQILLFSTDEEIIGEYLERLNPWIGQMYHLSYDDEAGTTQIKPGYFEIPEAA
ncbi:MAG: DNA sulfur modification protein DndD [Gammaproteobacteria bacterium]|nr:DNA sulfur modification protein DndD [Gammaproteobacteria bacterium]